MTRFVQYSRTGSPDVLEVVDGPTPAPGAGEVLVAVKAVGVNPLDWKQRSGVRPVPADSFPARVGSDAAGVVSELGPDVDGVAIGDRVVVVGAQGAYASDLVVAADRVTPLPQELTFDQGAAVGIPVSTAYQSLASLGVGQGARLLIHGGSGGVGQAAVQIARAWGAEVVATASEPNHERLRDLGATAVAYGPGLLDRLRELAPDGYDRVLDAVGTDEALEASLEVVSDPQHVATIVQGARAAGLGIQAYSGGSPEPLTPEQQRLRAEAIPVVLELAAAGQFEIEIGSRYALDDVAQAHRESESGHVRGKIVLEP